MTIAVDNDLFQDKSSDNFKVAILIMIILHELAHLKIGLFTYKL